MAFLFLIGRLILGSYFVYAGFSHFNKSNHYAGYAKAKGVPAPKTAVLLTGLMLIFGGLSIFFGIFIHVAIWVLIVFLLGVSYSMHAFWTIPDPQTRSMEMIGFMKNIALVGALLMMFAIPLPWVYSLFIR